jgi:hypothetical protein
MENKVAIDILCFSGDWVQNFSLLSTTIAKYFIKRYVDNPTRHWIW